MKKMSIFLILFLFSICATFSLDLVWDPNPVNDLVTSYNVYEKTGTSSYKFFKNVTGTNWTLPKLTTGPHTFIVTAVNWAGESVKSDPVTTPVPLKVKNVRLE